MCQWRGYLCILYVVLQCYLQLVDNAVLYEGSNCKSPDVPDGTCTRATMCPPAIESLKRTHSSGLKRCGFVDRDELVCCPSVNIRKPDDNDLTSTEIDNIFTSTEDNSKPTRFIKRKYEQACEDISAFAKSEVNFHIIGGTNADNAEFPHMAALGYEVDNAISWDCSASIISKKFLVTAAHCIANLKQLVPKIVRLGVTKLNETNPQDFFIKNITVFPKYNPTSKHNDIALIEVNKEIKYSKKVCPACLYFKNDDPTGLIVTGWGKTSIAIEDDRSNILQKATLVPYPLHKCNISYFSRTIGSKTIVQTQICAGSNESDACWGDSGGPLQIQNIDGTFSVVGIISYGAGCGGKIPGVYTRVSKYLEWIENIVWP
ncbi:serine protease persephone-like [Anoplophora glabripennis]|uniref:serine protease persephone-like n=1 Tax=Anoplophora glabripennis TaxID=217634 RepID=UPI00087351F1|nr:serine protease persephone-like [Anoplophora glabripennis]